MSQLPHCAYQFAESPELALQSLMTRPETEVDLAASKHFWDFEGDLNEIYQGYDRHFIDLRNQFTEIMGPPKFSGGPVTEGYGQTMKQLPDVDDVVRITIWRYQQKIIYLRFTWEDQEIPILIALGTEGSQETGEEYPGQF